MGKTNHIICIKWGTAYGSKDVNGLEQMLAENTSLPYQLHCFTDDTEGINGGISTHPLPVLNVGSVADNYSYKKEAALCDDELGGLAGERVLFLDLDVLITGSLDDFFTHPKGKNFYIINDWNSRSGLVGQASCYSFVVGTLGFVKDNFEQTPKAFIEQFGTASQEYLSDQVTRHYEGGMHFWPSEWCRSFRFHCLPFGPFRRFMVAKLPKGAKIIAFHGSPKAEDALQGKWTHPAPLLKRLFYKNCRPTPWIKDYLRLE